MKLHTKIALGLVPGGLVGDLAASVHVDRVDREMEGAAALAAGVTANSVGD